jgi:hypothetical protein
MLAYGIVLVISLQLLSTPRPAAVRYPLVLTPILPLLFVPLIVLRFFRAIDELQQRIHMEALAFAFAGSAVVTFAFGLLQGEGLPTLRWIWVYPIMCLLWGIGLLVARRRYR